MRTGGVGAAIILVRGSAFSQASTDTAAWSIACCVRPPRSNRLHIRLSAVAASVRLLSSALLTSSRVNVAVLAMFAALRNTKMMRSVRALDGFSHARTAFAFSPALRSSDIFALALRSSSLLHLPSALMKVIVCPDNPTRSSEGFIGRRRLQALPRLMLPGHAIAYIDWSSQEVGKLAK